MIKGATDASAVSSESLHRRLLCETCRMKAGGDSGEAALAKGEEKSQSSYWNKWWTRRCHLVCHSRFKNFSNFGTTFMRQGCLVLLFVINVLSSRSRLVLIFFPRVSLWHFFPTQVVLIANLSEVSCLLLLLPSHFSRSGTCVYVCLCTDISKVHSSTGWTSKAASFSTF